jgi:hypothetical protein
VLSSALAAQSEVKEAAAANAVASVHVRWASVTPAQAGRRRISLLPIDVALPDELTRAAAVSLWTRPLSGDGQRWDALPIGTYQIVIRAAAGDDAAAAPHEVGEFILAPGDDRTIEVALPPISEIRDAYASTSKQGATAAIRVRSGRDAGLVPGVRITAARAHDLAAMHKELSIDRAALGTAVTDAAGWARIPGLPREEIVFLFDAPGRSFPQISEPYVLPEAEETVIDDVLLEAPSTVFVTVSIAEKLQNTLQLREVELLPTGHNHWPPNVPIRGILGATGATIEDMPPGAWRVVATGRLKNGFAIHAAEAAVDVVPGVDRYVSLTMNDSLYQGRVTRDGLPVAGAINLKPADRRSGRRTAVATLAADGTFQVLLEGRGEYSVRVQEQNGSGAMLDEQVLFDDPEDEVSINLPAGRIHGRVVDGAGAPVAGAVITATRQSSSPAGVVFARNHADGSFTLDSVAPGPWAIAASTEGAQSEAVAVALDESDVRDIRLIVEPIELVTVRVIDGSGAPLRDAFVTAEFLPPGAVRPSSEIRSTGADGTAEFRVSRAQQATPTNLVVATSDIRLSCALRRLQGNQTVTVTPHAGEVRLLGREWGTARGVQGWLVSSSGCGVPSLATRIERDRPGEAALVFPKIAAGTWSYVETRTPAEVAAILTGRAASLPAIRSFHVESGGSTKVVLPSER